MSSLRLTLQELDTLATLSQQSVQRTASLTAMSTFTMSAEDQALMHRTIRVYWTDERRWFRGVVDNVRESHVANFGTRAVHHVTYADGDKRWHVLTGGDAAAEIWEQVGSAPRRPPDPKTSAPPPPAKARRCSPCLLYTSPSPRDA